MTQEDLADWVRLSRGYVAMVELARANPSLGVVERISRALGMEIEFSIRPPTILDDGRQRDLVHARCSGYVDRRLRLLGWQTAREVEIAQERSHGWIDILALHPTAETLLIVEIKTRLDDLGAIERQIGWYARSGGNVARARGWRPRRIVSWLLLLASEEVEQAIRSNRDVLSIAFPVRAPAMLAWLADGAGSASGWGLALLDPTSKRRDWLIRTRIDGRRSPPTFDNYVGAARRLAR
jgi:transcriptional regulator with XRE-family HTH domain